MTIPATDSVDSPVGATSGRYIRQEIFPAIGRSGQERLARTHVLLIGCGALGSTIADLLVRSGIGKLTIADRDYVELHNLQRQSLYDESDVINHLPKAAAAGARLRAINAEVEIISIISDIDASNIASLALDADILVDGTDNFETRYLVNDLAVKTGKPWVYGGVISSYGMTMTIIPGVTPCLRCVFPEPPEPGTAPTCDTAGVIAPAVHVVASLQAAEVLKLAVGDRDNVNRQLIAIDTWGLSFDEVNTGDPKPDCPACALKSFEFLESVPVARDTVLCGHDAVQVRVHPPAKLDLESLAARLRPVGDVLVNPYLIRFIDRVTGQALTIFPDGRAIIKGTTDPAQARAIYARYVGV